MKFNPKQKSQLAASGELSPLALKNFLEEVAENPDLKAEYDAACREFDVLGVLPIPEPSAAERRAIPARMPRASPILPCAPCRPPSRARAGSTGSGSSMARLPKNWRAACTRLRSSCARRASRADRAVRNGRWRLRHLDDIYLQSY